MRREPQVFPKSPPKSSQPPPKPVTSDATAGEGNDFPDAQISRHSRAERGSISAGAPRSS